MEYFVFSGNLFRTLFALTNDHCFVLLQTGECREISAEMEDVAVTSLSRPSRAPTSAASTASASAQPKSSNHSSISSQQPLVSTKKKVHKFLKSIFQSGFWLEGNEVPSRVDTVCHVQTILAIFIQQTLVAALMLLFWRKCLALGSQRSIFLLLLFPICAARPACLVNMVWMCANMIVAIR